MGVGVTVQADSILLVEASGTAAGVYTGTVVLPPNATLIDVIVHAEALWTAGTSATLKVGDVTDDDGFFIGVNLKATDLLAGESISMAHTGNKKGADIDFFTQTVNSAVIDDPALQHVRRRMLTAARSVKAICTTVGTVGTAGRTRVTVVYAMPQDTIAAFVAT